jgi:hypothetical protein
MDNMIEEMKISTPWKVIDCHNKDCWCGVIVPENYDDETIKL